MTSGTLALGAAFGAGAAVVYGVVAWRVARPGRVPEARLAGILFAVWWGALAASTLVGAASNGLAAAGVQRPGPFVVLMHGVLLLICLALWGLLYYLLYLFTGRRSIIWSVTAFYAVCYATLAYVVTLRGPVGVDVGRWSVTVVYREPLGGALPGALLALLLLPGVLGALAYFSLYGRVRDATVRYRATLVSWSIIVWFLSSFLATVAGLSSSDWWQALARLIGLGAAVTVWAAYDPPAWVRRRLGVRSIDEEAAVPSAWWSPAAGAGRLQTRSP